MRLTNIKTFKFKVCDASHYPHIDKTINDFIVDKDIISIDTKIVDEYHHNNNCTNTTAIWFIIHYAL